MERNIGRWQPAERPVPRVQSTPSSSTGGLGASHRLRRRTMLDRIRPGGGRDTPPWRPIAVIAAILLPLSLVGVACGTQIASPNTARVTRDAVSTTVSGTGALRAISEQKIGFNKGGKITEVNVTVGQQVKAGTVLGRIDDFAARADVRKAAATVAREEATLETLSDSEKIDAAADDAKSAEGVLSATRDQSDQIDRANDKAVENARRGVRIAFARARSAQIAFEADEARCRKSVGGDSRRRPGEVRQPGGLAGELYLPAPVEAAACDRARKSGAQLAEAEGDLAKAQGDVRTAQQKRNTDHAEQAVAISNAKRAHNAAKFDAKDAKKTRPHEIEAQEAAVEDAKADLAVAQRAVEDTVLIAAVDGKVAAINGTVGEYVGGGSGTTPQSPGSKVSLPDVSSDLGEAASADTKSERPGLGSFMVLTDVHAFEVVVPFEESDAVKIKRNQRVDLTFDSVPGLTKQGTVVSISPSGASIQDVTNYYATIVLNDGGDDRLRDGQTVQAGVVVGQVNNALVVPNSALQQGGQTGLVTVLDPDGTQRQVQVQLGARGDETTEILSGLTEGQEVVVAES
jgi:HlyD family secretion protein